MLLQCSALNNDEEQTRKFLDEVSMLKNLQHKNILTMEGISKINGQYCIILPYMANGDLRTFLRRTKDEVR